MTGGFVEDDVGQKCFSVDLVSSRACSVPCCFQELPGTCVEQSWMQWLPSHGAGCSRPGACGHYCRDQGLTGILTTAWKPWGIQNVTDCFRPAQGICRKELAFVGAAEEALGDPSILPVVSGLWQPFLAQAKEPSVTPV